MIKFSDKTKNEFDTIVKRFPTKKAALLSTLRLAEREFGYVDNDICEYVAGLLEISPAHVMGFVSFYTHFRRPEHGKYRILICSTLMCAMKGSEEIFDHLKSKLGIGPGERTIDGLFSIEKCECLAACGGAPAVMVNDKLYENMTIEKIDRLIEQLKNE